MDVRLSIDDAQRLCVEGSMPLDLEQYQVPVPSKLGLISIDSTMRSNLAVGLPLDVMVLRRDALKAEGVDILFAYPVNPLIEAAAAEHIRTIIVRQERVGLLLVAWDVAQIQRQPGVAGQQADHEEDQDGDAEQQHRHD